MLEDMLGIDRFTRWLFIAVLIIFIVIFSSLANSVKKDNSKNVNTARMEKINE